MLKRPKPKQLSEAAQKAVNEASAQQTGQAAAIKSYDPNYPVFDVPVNKKILVYIPNHTEMLPDGSVTLRMDKFAAHSGLDGRSFVNVRCSQGIISEELGLDGSCPLCTAMADVWELYNKEYADIGRARGIDIQSAEAQEALKEERKKLVQAMVIKNPEIWYTFPIVVIDCEERDGQLTVIPKKDAENRITGTPMWYSIRERTYLEKWATALDTIETEDGIAITHPAGRWAVLNFTYTPKSGSHDKMNSARALKVGFKTMAGYNEWATYFDQLTEEWTPQKAQEVVVLDVLRDMEEMTAVADTLMAPVRDKLAMYSLSAGGAVVPTQGSAESALAGFGGTPVEEGAVGSPTGGLPAGGNLTAEMPGAGVEAE